MIVKLLVFLYVHNPDNKVCCYVLVGVVEWCVLTPTYTLQLLWSV